MSGRYPHPSPLVGTPPESPFGVKPPFPTLATDLLASPPPVLAPTQGVCSQAKDLHLNPVPELASGGTQSQTSREAEGNCQGWKAAFES